MKHLTHHFFSQPFRLSFMQFDRGITNRNGGWKERVHLLRKPHGIQVALCVSRRLKSFPISVPRYHAPANSPTRNPAGNPLPGLYSQSSFECVNLLDLFFTIFLFLFFFSLQTIHDVVTRIACLLANKRNEEKRRKKGENDTYFQKFTEISQTPHRRHNVGSFRLASSFIFTVTRENSSASIIHGAAKWRRTDVDSSDGNRNTAMEGKSSLQLRTLDAWRIHEGRPSDFEKKNSYVENRRMWIEKQRRD